MTTGMTVPARMQMESDNEEAYHNLLVYTHTRGDSTFIHQHVVDAWAAQHATETSKPIGVAFALFGLYLKIERHYTGREVQRAHMKLGKHRWQWPRFDLPANRGDMTAADVMAAPEGADRDRAIDAWCQSVWGAFADSRDRVRDLLAEHGIA